MPGKVKSVKRVGRGGNSRPVQRTGPPPFSANTKVVCKRRWVLRPSVGTDKVSDKFSVGISAASLCCSIGMVTDDAAVPMVAHGLFAAVKILSVQAWYAAPVKNATGTAADMPSEGMYQITIDPSAAVASSAVQLGQISDSSIGPDDCAYIRFLPTMKDYPRLASFQSGADQTVCLYVTGYMGMIVDIQAEYIVADGNAGPPFTVSASSPATDGTMVYAALDLGVTAGSRSWQPVGSTYVAT